MGRRAVVVSLAVGLPLVVAGGVVGSRVVTLLTEDAPAVPASWSPPAALPTAEAMSTDRFAFSSDRTGTFEIFTEGLDGSDPVQLTDDPRYDSWFPRVSPDRRTIAFYRSPAGVHDRDHAKVSLWAMAADGTGVVELRPVGLDGWVLQGHAEWAPDGRSLVMFGGSRLNPQIHVTDALGQSPRAVTDRPGTNLDPSFSPDGTRIAFVGCPQAVCREPDYEVYLVDVDGGGLTRVTDDHLRDHDPRWSPDGTRLAWLTSFGGAGVGVWDVRIGGPEGQDPVRLFDDAGVTSRPEFTPDGRWVLVHRIPPGGTSFDVYRIAPDGSGAVEVTRGQPGSNEYPSP